MIRKKERVLNLKTLVLTRGDVGSGYSLPWDLLFGFFVWTKVGESGGPHGAGKVAPLYGVTGRV